MIDFSSLLGMQPPTPAGPIDGPGYAALLNPAPAVPAANPTAVAAPNPANMLRAIGLAGSSLVQPLNFGMSPLAGLGRAFNVGQTAYDAGNAAQFAQDLALAKENRAQTESEANVALTKARTEGTEASTTGQRTANEVADATKQAQIDKATKSVDLIVQQIENAKRQGKISDIELGKAQRAWKIAQSLPESAEKEALLADIEKRIGAVDLQKAQQKKAEAEADEATSKGGYWSAMRDLVNNGGKAGKGGTSANVQAAKEVEAAYRIAHPKSPEETDDQFEQRVAQAKLSFFTNLKKSDFGNLFFKWAENNGTTDPVADLARFKQVYEAIYGKADGLQIPNPAPGTTAGGAVTGKVQQVVRDPKTGKLKLQ